MHPCCCEISSAGAKTPSVDDCAIHTPGFDEELPGGFADPVQIIVAAPSGPIPIDAPPSGDPASRVCGVEKECPARRTAASSWVSREWLRGCSQNTMVSPSAFMSTPP